LAAKAVPATSVVAMSAAANVLNMVFSLVFLRRADCKIAPIFGNTITPAALNAA
jgi:hypothetical protein